MANYFNGGLVFDKQTGQRISGQTATLLDSNGAQQPTYDQAGAAVQVTTDSDGFFQPFTANIKRGFLVFGAGFRYEVISSTVFDQADHAYNQAVTAQQLAAAAKDKADAAVPNTRAVSAGPGISGGGRLDTDIAVAIGSGVTPLTARVVDSGSIDDLGVENVIIRHTNTPPATWGAYEGRWAGYGTLIQRFWADLPDRSFYYERVRNGNGSTQPYSFSPWVRSPTPPVIIASRGINANQSIPSVTSTAVSWSKVHAADSGLIPYAGNEWTVPSAGRYRISATLSYAYRDATTWNLRQVIIVINGSQPEAGITTEDRTAAAVVSIDRVYPLAAGAKIRIHASQHTGQNMDIKANECSAIIQRIGD